MDEILEYYMKIFAITFSIGLCLRAYFNYKAKYFSRKGLYAYPSLPFVGCLGPLLFQRQSGPDHVQTLYNELKPYKIAGIYDATKPAYFITDPDLLKNIMVKDFEHFVDRLRTIPADSGSVFGKNLMSLKGNQWHCMRTTLSPAFTGSKMKSIFVLMTRCAEQLVEFLTKTYNVNEESEGDILSLEMKDVWTRFAADVIGTTAYGVEINSLQNPENEFLLCGKSMTYIGGTRLLAFLGHSTFPKLMKMLRFPLLEPKAEKYFSSLIKTTVRTREEQNIVRPDMIHLLMQAKKGSLKSEPDDVNDDYHPQKNMDESALDISEDHIVGQAVIFFFAGFDTVSTVLTFASYFLATNQEVQSKVREEINSVTNNLSRVLTYEDLTKMKYLHMVVSETLRRCSVPQMDRVCVKDYTIPATTSSPEVQVKKGEGIWIPIYSIHHDPEYFPNPEKFDPERFHEENIHNIRPFTYLPFGMGPRNCIGMRFALMEIKIALVYLLSNFELCRVKKTPEQVAFSSKSLSMNLEGGAWVGIVPRNHKNECDKKSI